MILLFFNAFLEPAIFHNTSKCQINYNLQLQLSTKGDSSSDPGAMAVIVCARKKILYEAFDWWIRVVIACWRMRIVIFAAANQLFT